MKHAAPSTDERVTRSRLVRDVPPDVAQAIEGFAHDADARVDPATFANEDAPPTSPRVLVGQDGIALDRVAPDQALRGEVTLPKFYALSYEVQVHALAPQWAQIVRFNPSSDPAHNYPRPLAHWLTPGDTRVHAKAATREDANRGPDTPPLTLGQWATVAVAIMPSYVPGFDHAYNVYVNDRLVHEERDASPNLYGKMWLWIGGDTGSRYQRANATVRNMVLTPLLTGDTKQELLRTLRARLGAFQRHTDSLGQLNEAYNANRYILDGLAREKARVDRVNAAAQREAYMEQQRFLMTHYRAEYYDTATSVAAYALLCFALVLMALAAWLQGRIATATFGIVVALVAAVFVTITTFIVLRASRRRQARWNRYRWASPVAPTKQECADDE